MLATRNGSPANFPTRSCCTTTVISPLSAGRWEGGPLASRLLVECTGADVGYPSLPRIPTWLMLPKRSTAPSWVGYRLPHPASTRTTYLRNTRRYLRRARAVPPPPLATVVSIGLAAMPPFGTTGRSMN